MAKSEIEIPLARPRSERPRTANEIARFGRHFSSAVCANDVRTQSRRLSERHRFRKLAGGDFDLMTGRRKSRRKCFKEWNVW